MFAIGASLREARLRRELAPADVQKALRIRERYLQALEDEQWELLPGDAYVKGFLRSYADFLGLDGNLYVDEYVSRFGTAEERPLAPQPLHRLERDRRGVGLLLPLIAIAAIVAIVAAVAAWQLDRSSKTSNSNTTTTNSTTTTSTHHRRRHVAVPKKAILVASRGPCWLEIRRGSAHGTLIYESTLEQGRRLAVDLTPGRVWISFGYAANVDVHLGSERVHLPTIQPGGAVLLGRRGLQPG